MIDIKYKIALVGKYNKSVCICPSCDCNLVERLFDNIIGFNDSHIGQVFMCECPKCFTKWYAHIGDSYYDYFLDSIKAKKNLHFMK